MKQVKCFSNLRWIGGILFLILFLAACQKNLTESNIDSKKPTTKSISELQNKVEAFAARIKAKKSGQLVSRDGDPLSVEDANDLVEGAMNYNYCDASIPYWNISVDDTTIVVPLTEGKIAEEDSDELYENALEFAGYRFCKIEDEDKTPRAYDLEIEGTEATSVTIKVTSIVGYGTIYSPFSRKTFDTGDYEADIATTHCSPASTNNAPELMKQFVNYNVVFAISAGYFLVLQGNQGHTNEGSGHDFAWSFRCSGLGGGSCCSCSNACSGYNLADVYCLDENLMNDYLDEFEYNFTHEGFWVYPGTQFIAITKMAIDHDCENTSDITDSWEFDWFQGTVMSNNRELLTLLCD